MTYHHDDLTSAGEAGFDRRLFGRLAGYARPHLALAAAGLGLVATATALGLAMPAFLRLAVDDVAGRTVADAPPGALLATLVIAFVAVEIVRLANNYLQLFLLQVLGQRVVFDLRMDLVRRLQDRPLAFFGRHPVGRLVTRVVFDIETLAELFGAGLITLVMDLCLVAGIAVALVAIDVRLGLLTLSILPPLVVVTIFFRRHVRRTYREVARQRSVVNADLAENLNGIRDVQAFVREAVNRERFRAHNDAYMALQIDAVHRWGLFQPAFGTLSSVGIALVIAVVGTAVTEGRLELGVFAQFFFLVKMLADPLRELAEKYNVVQTAMASADRVFRMIDEPADPILATPRASRPPPTGRIEFDGVRFAYPGAEDRPALDGVSFEIQPGRSVALVGHTGAGKSTIVNLLCRHYDPTGGRVAVDGIDLREWHPLDLRPSIAVVDQDVFLFAGDVRSNLTLGQDYTDREVAEAAALVGADRFIENLPGGYRAPVVERGATLSAGQRQLIGFARALLRRPPILVLDEATSQVDTPAERLIQEAIETLIADRTSLVIAHRLSTVRRCDRILVLDRGRLVEDGSHEELLAAGGLYEDLYRRQFQE